MWGLVTKPWNRAVYICFVEPSAGVHCLLSGLVFFLLSMFVYLFFFTLRSAGRFLWSLHESVQASFHPVLYLHNFDREPDLLTWHFGFYLGYTSSLPTLPINLDCLNCSSLLQVLWDWRHLWQNPAPSCWESELPAHLPFLCYSLRCAKCFSLDLESVNWFIPQKLSFKLSLGCWGMVLCLSAVILNFFYTLLFTSWF